MIAVRFQVKGAISSYGTVMSKENEWCWLLTSDWVVATSCKLHQHNTNFRPLPKDIMLFKDAEDAYAFVKTWKGHPWYNVPNGVFECVTVKPHMVQDGWEPG